MERRVELFYLGDDDTPSGGLVTEWDQITIRTHIVFSTVDGQITDTTATITHQGSASSWTAVDFLDGDEQTTLTRYSDGFGADGERGQTEPEVVTSYAASVLVQEICQLQRNSLTFQWLDESTLTVAPAELRAAGEETITSPVAGQLSGCM